MDGQLSGDSEACRGLSDDLGWALGTVFRSYAKTAGEVLSDVPGGPRGFQVLAAAADGLAGTQLALAAHLGVDRTVMTYLLDDLEGAGLIERQPDPADRRARRIVITAPGRDLRERLDTRLDRAEEHVLSALAPAERATFRALLGKVAAAATAPGQGTDMCRVVEEATTTEPARRRRRAPARPSSR